MSKSLPEKGRILVIDDTPINVTLLVDMLARRYYIVESAESGMRGLELAFANPPEVILLDINMPRMNGYEVCQRLKADERTTDIPVIFISALNDTDDIVRAFDVGGVDYITKPFKIREVLARVEGQMLVYRQRKQIEHMAGRERQQALLLDQMRREFIGSATHDLKNPIALIVGYASLLKDQPSLSEDAEAQDFITQIMRAGTKMQGLVTDMLDLLQLERGVSLVLEPADLVAFTREHSRDHQMSADNKQQTLTVELPEAAIPVLLDEPHFARVLDNLISNAIKYTALGGQITVRALAQSGVATLEVSDTGLGIPEDALDKLFSPFFRVNSIEHRQQEGTGLGLSIVKSLVEGHGGQISVESTLGVGSTFRVALPLQD